MNAFFYCKLCNTIVKNNKNKVIFFVTLIILSFLYIIEVKKRKFYEKSNCKNNNLTNDLFINYVEFCWLCI